MIDARREPWLTEVHHEAARRLERVAEVQAELSTLDAEAHTAEGRVRVRVNAAGRPIALTLEPTVRSMAAHELSAAILEAVQDAGARAGERVADLVGTLLSSDELDAMLTGRPTEADRLAVRAELDELSLSDG